MNRLLSSKTSNWSAYSSGGPISASGLNDLTNSNDSNIEQEEISGNLIPPTVTNLAAAFNFSPWQSPQGRSVIQLISLVLVLLEVVSI